VAFGCFVQDAAGSTVATLSFQAASTAGTALTVSSSTSLGNITVDFEQWARLGQRLDGNGGDDSPRIELPNGNLGLPDRRVRGGVHRDGTANNCDGLGSADCKRGCCTVSLTHGPESHGQGVCSYGSWGGLPGVYSSGVLTFGPFNGNSGGGVCQQPITFQMSPNASCTSATAAVHFEGCTTCGTGSNGLQRLRRHSVRHHQLQRYLQRDATIAVMRSGYGAAVGAAPRGFRAVAEVVFRQRVLHHLSAKACPF